MKNNLLYSPAASKEGKGNKRFLSDLGWISQVLHMRMLDRSVQDYSRQSGASSITRAPELSETLANRADVMLIRG